MMMMKNRNIRLRAIKFLRKSEKLIAYSVCCNIPMILMSFEDNTITTVIVVFVDE